MNKRSGTNKNRTHQPRKHQEVEQLLAQMSMNVDVMRKTTCRDGTFYDAYRTFLVQCVDLHSTLDELYTCDPGAKAAYDGFISLHGTR